MTTTTPETGSDLDFGAVTKQVTTEVVRDHVLVGGIYYDPLRRVTYRMCRCETRCYDDALEGSAVIDYPTHVGNEVETALLGHLDGYVHGRVTAALGEAARRVHVARFAAEEGTLRGPDNYYNGVQKAERLVREYAEELATSGTAPQPESGD